VRAAGLLLLMGSFLAAAFAAMTDARAVPWQWFLPAFVAGAAGVAMVRRAERQTRRSAALQSAHEGRSEECLGRVIDGLEALLSGAQPVPPWEYRFEIDRRFRDDLAAFAESRYSLADLYGLAAFAEVMGAFAAGERYLNRVWSASADGYLDEARIYLERSLEQFRDAARQLSGARANVADVLPRRAAGSISAGET